MNKKKAKLITNTILLKLLKKEILSCVLFLKRNFIKDLNYWNVELQEAYFSPAS